MTKEEAEAIRQEIVAIHEKYDGCAELISMSVQPQCPKCNQLLRFSDSYCSNCGVELAKGDDE
jgi:predicted amidophosphoribosyltransferase